MRSSRRPRVAMAMRRSSGSGARSRSGATRDSNVIMLDSEVNDVCLSEEFH